MSSNDAWLLYADTRDRLIALVRPLDTEQAAMVVPITSGWSMAAVVAHVCGLNADIAAGMREGLGTDERTTHQVETRAGRTIAELCDEWLTHGPAMQAAIDESEFLGRRLSADLVVHLHDLQHGLGEPLDTSDGGNGLRGPHLRRPHARPVGGNRIGERSDRTDRREPVRTLVAYGNGRGDRSGLGCLAV